MATDIEEDGREEREYTPRVWFCHWIKELWNWAAATVFLLPSWDPALEHLPSQISSLTQVKNRGLIYLQSAFCRSDSLRSLTNPVLMQVLIVKTALREYDGVSEDQKLLTLLSRLMQTNSVFLISGSDWFVSLKFIVSSN